MTKYRWLFTIHKDTGEIHPSFPRGISYMSYIGEEWDKFWEQIQENWKDRPSNEHPDYIYVFVEHEE